MKYETLHYNRNACKLTEAQVDFIHRMAMWREELDELRAQLTDDALAELIGTHTNNVYRIRKGISWRDNFVAAEERIQDFPDIPTGSTPAELKEAWLTCTHCGGPIESQPRFVNGHSFHGSHCQKAYERAQRDGKALERANRRMA